MGDAQRRARAIERGAKGYYDTRGIFQPIISPRQKREQNIANEYLRAIESNHTSAIQHFQEKVFPEYNLQEQQRILGFAQAKINEQAPVQKITPVQQSPIQAQPTAVTTTPFSAPDTPLGSVDPKQLLMLGAVFLLAGGLK